MFTGIIETLGQVLRIEREGSNIHFNIACAFLNELKVDQSVAHNGVCLTVTQIHDDHYTVTAIEETIRLSNLSLLREGDDINLERAVKFEQRMDGHLVQGHVDGTAEVSYIEIKNGSHEFTFTHSPHKKFIHIDKGSVCINGVSLTLINPQRTSFKVAIIPFTFQHTNFKTLKVGDRVNIEYDLIGKYIIERLDQIKNHEH